MQCDDESLFYNLFEKKKKLLLNRLFIVKQEVNCQSTKVHFQPWSLIKENQTLLLSHDSSSFPFSHYSKSQILTKNSILTKPQHFNEFFAQFFLLILLVKSKLSTTKNFHEFFTPKKNSAIFSGNQS